MSTKWVRPERIGARAWRKLLQNFDRDRLDRVAAWSAIAPPRSMEASRRRRAAKLARVAT